MKRILGVFLCVLILLASQDGPGRAGLDAINPSGTPHVGSEKLQLAAQKLEKLRDLPKIPQGGPSKTQRRHALIIGNNDYANLETLEKAIGDAKTIGTVLTELGFEVTLVQNVKIDDFDEQLDEFYDRLQSGDIAFFFFAGHGVAAGDSNFLLPVDMPKLSALKSSRLKRKAIDAHKIVAGIKARGVKLAFVVLDACREDPFRRDGLRAARALGGLTSMVPQEGVFVIYSAGTGQTALDALTSDDPDPNSVFTRKFWPILKTPGLPIVDIAKRTQVEVRELAAKVEHRQAPAYYDQVIGQFFFQPPKPKLYGIVIGIDEYDREVQLQGAVNDAERIGRALEAIGAAHVVRIFNRDARRQFIDFAWRSMVQRANPGDTIVFSYSGASSQLPASGAPEEPDGANEFLALADTNWRDIKTLAPNPDFRSVLIDDDLTAWMELAAAKNVSVVLNVDGCHGGGLLDREFANVTFLGASAENESVLEFEIDGRSHGAMSVAFANAIEGAADMNSDGFVTQRELFRYVLPEVYKFAPKDQNPQFLPDLESGATDLALFKIPKHVEQRKASLKAPWPATASPRPLR